MKTSYASKCVSILFDARFCSGRKNLRAWSRGSETCKEDNNTKNNTFANLQNINCAVIFWETENLPLPKLNILPN